TYYYTVAAKDGAGNLSALAVYGSATTSVCGGTTTTIATTSSTSTTTVHTTTSTSTLKSTTSTSLSATTTPTPTTSLIGPQLVGFLPGIGDAMDVRVMNSRAYVASDIFGLSTLDVSSASAPSVLGSANLAFDGEHVAVGGTRAVVTGQKDGLAHLWV